MLELTQLPHYVAGRAGAPVCFFLSNRAEPTNCERKLSAPVVVYYGNEWDEWKRPLFLSIPWQKKAKRAPAMRATALCCLAAW